MTRAAAHALMTAVLTAGVAACNSGGAPPGEAPRAASGAPLDSVQGTAAIVGAVPLTRVVVRPADGGAEVEIVGAQAEALSRLTGAEVRVLGRQARGTAGQGRALEAVSFSVVSVDGQPAVDGRLEREGGQLVLVTADGRRIRLVQPPAALQDWVGARVWVSGPLDREPQAFGLIEPRA